jgi:prolactin regulatory element-binding protein
MSSVLLGFPVFCVGFLPNGRLLVGGGGGATKAGVKNALVLLDTLTGDTLQEYLFSKQDDGCMSLAIHPKVSLSLLEIETAHVRQHHQRTNGLPSESMRQRTKSNRAQT